MTKSKRFQQSLKLRPQRGASAASAALKTRRMGNSLHSILQGPPQDPAFRGD
ncbi:MAG: hypothetical protein OXQ84_09660 [bacterium]|nr:hypothetical protein [bacterium]